VTKKHRALIAFARGEIETTTDVRRLLQQGNIQSAQSVVKSLLRDQSIREAGVVALSPTSPVRMRRGSKLAKRYVITHRGQQQAAAVERD